MLILLRTSVLIVLLESRLLANNGIYYIKGRICEGIFNLGCEDYWGL